MSTEEGRLGTPPPPAWRTASGSPPAGLALPGLWLATCRRPDWTPPSGLLPVTWAGQEANTLVNLSWKPQQWSQEQGEAAHAQAQNSRQGGSWFCTGRPPLRTHTSLLANTSVQSFIGDLGHTSRQLNNEKRLGLEADLDPGHCTPTPRASCGSSIPNALVPTGVVWEGVGAVPGQRLGHSLPLASCPSSLNSPGGKGPVRTSVTSPRG